jgi:hypothetical protein
MRSKTGSMPTDRPERYAKQLASHWASRGSVVEEDGATVLRWPTGQTIVLRPEPGSLHVEVTLTDDAVTPARGDSPQQPAQIDAFAEVVARHLERFGARDELLVTWHD